MSAAQAEEVTYLAGRAGRRRLTLGLYVVAALLYWISLYLYMPTLPTYVASKTGNLAVVGTVLSMYGLWQAVIRVPLGIAADWLGWRKPFIAGGLVLAGLGAWVMATAGGVQGLAVGRAITGLAAGTWVPLVVVFSSLFPPEDAVRASALLTLFGSLGRMVATLVTGSLNDLGGYALAFYLAAGAALLAVLVVLPAREARRPPQRPKVAAIGRLIVRRDVLLPSLLAAVSQYANWAATFGFVPILAKQFGASDVLLSLMTSLNIGMLALGNVAASAVANRLGARRLVYLSFALMAAGIAGAGLARSLGLLVALQMGIGLSQGVSYPVLMGMSIERVAEAERNTAMGLHQAVYAVGMFGGPWLSGKLADAMGIGPMLAATGVATLVVGFGVARLLAASRTRGEAPA